ncbi:macro domain-containing protein [Sphingobacterium faecale]|uniref:Macro domain-containing protein n=1 Tax=Sphingobacterium faecale TaxID=2803775 RepID=A0ABS1R4F5_9SPHI|nr:macro domain-containing protein [Sphingobacterium faecale]MBL1408716.1 macro domain-containing protein [Sphingobacterium faecale]
MRVEYIKGDATAPTAAGNKIIVHVCNDIGAWGKGFVMAISKKWKEPAKQYKAWYKSQDGFELGEVQFVQVEDDTWIANMIGQHKIYRDEQGNPPIRYEAIRSALEKVADHALQHDASVHMPRIGCGLAGGTWDKIEPLLKECMVSKGVQVTVYDF